MQSNSSDSCPNGLLLYVSDYAPQIFEVELIRLANNKPPGDCFSGRLKTCNMWKLDKTRRTVKPVFTAGVTSWLAVDEKKCIFFQRSQSSPCRPVSGHFTAAYVHVYFTKIRGRIQLGWGHFWRQNRKCRLLLLPQLWCSSKPGFGLLIKLILF